MRINLSRTEAQKKIDSFFQSGFTSEGVRKIKRLAMKFKIKLGPYRKKFCRKCFSSLKGKTRITKTHKTIICEKCSYKNGFKI